MIMKSSSTKNIYIVDYDRLNRARLAQLLRSRKFIVHPCSTGSELLAGLDYLTPGCVLLDGSMLEPGGFEMITALVRYRARFPMVVMIGSGVVAAAVKAMRAGAVDVIEKPIDPETLLATLATVFESLDDQVREDELRVAASTRLAALTGRERDVLRGLTAGRSNKLLAHDIGISIRTVEMHRSSMMDRLGVKTLADALRIAFDGAGQLDAALVRRVA